MNFFAIPVFSFIPPKYKELVKEKSGKVFGALLICFVILSLITAFSVVSGMGEFKQMMIDDCPDFDLTNGVFTIEEDFKYEGEDSYLYVSDDIDKVSAADVEKIAKANKKLDNIIIIGRKGCGNYDNGKIQTIDFDDFKTFTISKDKVVNTYLPALNVILVICCVIGAFFSIAIYYLMSLILQFLTGGFSKWFFKRQLDEKERFRITVLGKFPPHVALWLFSKLLFTLPFIVRLGIQMGFIILVLYFYTKREEGEYYQQPYQQPYNNDPYNMGQ